MYTPGSQGGGGRLLLKGPRGLFGALASRPNDPPGHIRKNFPRSKMTFIKGAGILRPILGTHTFFWPLTHPPTHLPHPTPQGSFFSLAMAWFWRGGGGGVWDPKLCAPQVARRNVSFRKFHLSHSKNFGEAGEGGPEGRP